MIKISTCDIIQLQKLGSNLQCVYEFLFEFIGVYISLYPDI